MTNPNSGRNLGQQNVPVQTIGAKETLIQDIQEKNAKLKSKGAGFSVDTAALHSADLNDIKSLHSRVDERFAGMFGEEPEQVGEESTIISDIIELADEHQLSEIHIGTNTYSLMLAPLSTAPDEALDEILDALSVESGKVELTYTRSLNEKVDDLIGNERMTLSGLRSLTDEDILARWDSWAEETKGEDVSVEDVSVEDVSSESADGDQPTVVEVSSDESDEEDEDEFEDEALISQITVTLTALRLFNTEHGFAPLGILKFENVNFDLDSSDFGELYELTIPQLAELCVIVAERTDQVEAYVEVLAAGDFAEDGDDDDLEDDLEDFDITDDELDAHLENPEFDEFDELGMVEISNRLVINFPVNQEGADAFADRDLRKALSNVKGYVYDDEENLVELETTCNTVNLTSKKSNGWLRPALADIVKYLNRLNGSIPTFLSNPTDAGSFASSLGDSISEVLEILPIRSVFGQLVDVSGTMDEDGEIHSGLDERYTLNNYLALEQDADTFKATIVNHYTVDALTIHHNDVTQAVKTLLQTVSTRASIANFPVLTTFTFDAVEAMGSMNDIYEELSNQGFTPISRSEFVDLIANEEEHELLDLIGLSGFESADSYDVDIVFGNADILMYLPVVNL